MSQSEAVPCFSAHAGLALLVLCAADDARAGLGQDGAMECCAANVFPERV